MNSTIPKALVVIASHGEKNLSYLKRIIATYRSMTSVDVSITVLSNAPKDLGPGVKVVVETPSKRPFALTFLHKPLLAEEVDNYDLFIYSEDDIEITERNISAFLKATPLLKPDEIAGFFRYEVGPDGLYSYPDVLSYYHWKPETVRKSGPYTVAEFSNEHSACYLLTQFQFRLALASDGFLRPMYEEGYDLACTAATDPYTSCGFRKVLLISEFDDFLVHHLPDRYVAEGVGLSDSLFREQIATLNSIREGNLPTAKLLDNETKIYHRRWSKSYYEKPSETLLKAVPGDAKTVLSIGTGSGEIESFLAGRGLAVTALPLDSVIGAAAEKRGIEVIYGTLDVGFAALRGYTFDTVLVPNLLHLVPDPFELIDRVAKFVAPGGTLLVSGVNLDGLPLALRRLKNPAYYRGIESYEKGGIKVLDTSAVTSRIKANGLAVVSLTRLNGDRRPRKALRFAASNWLLTATARPAFLLNHETFSVERKTVQL
jgi:SAM-dependent methyltransferase